MALERTDDTRHRTDLGGPTGFDDMNSGVNNFVTFFWDKRAMALARAT